MTYPLTDQFNDPQGLWNGYAPWDATEASDGAKGFISTQKHVDLRSFRNITLRDARPQTELDAVAQTVLDSEPQTDMETKPVPNAAAENWVLTGTGLNAIAVGEIATRGGWSGLTTTTNGTAVNATLTSSIATPIDISPGQSLSIVFPDYQAWDTNSYVQLNSDPNGVFGNGFDSAQVTFASNTSAMPELRLPIASFAQSGFDNTKVTGVRVVLNKASAPANGLAVTMMAIRSLDSAWVVSWLDFDTRMGIICRPVTLNGNATTGTVAQNFQFIRGDGSKNDPIPTDLAMTAYFYPGGATSPNDATGSTYNNIAFMFREQKNSGAGTGSHIECGLKFNDTAATFYAKYVSTTGGSPGTEVDTGSYTASVSGVLDPTELHAFNVEIRGTQIIPRLYKVNSDHSIISLVWSNPTTLTNAAYVYRSGRVGFIANLISRDAYIDSLEGSPVGFSELQTQPFPSRMPVDGAQLAAVYASDKNLFTGMTGLFTIDPIKTVSGNGSYRTTQTITTEQFLVEDWTQMYLALSIWVPSTVTSRNQPTILLNSGASQQELFSGQLKPSQWNDLLFDLGLFRNLLTGQSYSFSIQPGATPDRPLGSYWVDSVTIGRRRVSWQVRATTNGPWRQFMTTVNDPRGAVHFNTDERGTQLQLKAVALTDDAWVGSFQLFPRYAQLGLPLFDQGGVYEHFDAA